MKDDIKEIISLLTSWCKEAEQIEDYIINLQEEVEDLREDNYAYHQLMKTQNAREYRSKFLKEFQEEFGTNVFPDYDEIYKRYDKLKKENERLKMDIRYWEDKWQYTKFSDKDYKSRIDKAKDKIQYIIDYGFDYDGFNTAESLKGLIDMLVDYAKQSKDILNGGDK